MALNSCQSYLLQRERELNENAFFFKARKETNLICSEESSYEAVTESSYEAEKAFLHFFIFIVIFFFNSQYS